MKIEFKRKLYYRKLKITPLFHEKRKQIEKLLVLGMQKKEMTFVNDKTDPSNRNFFR